VKWREWLKALWRSAFGDFIERQDGRIRLANLSAEVATAAYVHAVEQGDCKEQKRISLLYAMQEKRRAYYSKVEREILNCGNCRGAEYQRWIEEWKISATKVLNGAILYQHLLRKEREKVKLPDIVLEPSEGTYRSIQAFYAAVFGNQATAVLKERFAEICLPISGFDQPHVAPPAPPKKPMPPQVLGLIIVILIIGALVAAANYVNIFVLGGILPIALVLYIVVEIFGLRRDGKLKEKSLVDLLKIVLAKKFHFHFGGKKADENGPPIDQ
jgi:hypothetical protein